jgi:hypothetical protein
VLKNKKKKTGITKELVFQLDFLSPMKDTDETIAKIKKFQNFLIDMATGKDFDYNKYEEERIAFLSDSSYKSEVPDWIIDNRYGSQFWQFIGSKSGTYEGRRVFLRTAFDDLITYVEEGQSQAVSISLNSIVNKIPASKEIAGLWRKVHQRKADDPDGTITAARSLLETSMKCILEERGIQFGVGEDLRDLYKKVGKALNLSPDGHNEQVFKQILTGMTSIVQGFSSLRNAYGDAHGKSAGSVSPKPRHAELAINLAGTMSTFLIQTHLDNPIDK